MKKRLAKIFHSRAAVNFVFFTFIVSIIFVVVQMIFAPVSDVDDTGERVKGEYVLMLVQCVLGVAAMALPGTLERRFNLTVPSRMLVLYAVFLYCAIYLGEVRAFYYNVPHWDTILHTFSGTMLGALGYSVIVILNNAERIPIHLSPVFVAFFTFCFAMTLGVIWEFYEAFIDTYFGTNMQKFALEDGTQLVGRDALADTMKDLRVDMLGAAVMSVVGYISLKYDKGWLDRLLLKKRNKNNGEKK